MSLLFIFLLQSAHAFAKNLLVNEQQEPALQNDVWGDDNWADATVASPWKISGFIEVAHGQFLQNNIVTSNESLNELRARLELNYSHQHFDFTVKGDALYDDVLSSTIWHTRELTLSASPFKAVDIKIGRQILTWGTADYIFLNDLFPKDWQSFFAGREDQYLKSSSDSIKTSWYLGAFTVDIAWTPKFSADKYLTGERFSFYSPQAQNNVAPAEQFKVKNSNDEQWSARFSTNKKGIEYALYGYKGIWTTPTGINTEGTAYFPKMNSWGASIRMPFAGGLFNTEYAAYRSIEDTDGNDPFIANSQQRFLLGYETELIKNLSASLQYYLEHTNNYSAFKANSFYPQQIIDKNRQLLTLRLRYTALQQKLTFSLFTFYSPSDQDAYIRPSIHYRYSDSWSYTVGGNIFWGKQNFSFFGQHQDNSNAWLRMRYQF